MSIEIIRAKPAREYVNKSQLEFGKAYSKKGAEDYIYLIAPHDANVRRQAFRIDNKNKMTVYHVEELDDGSFYEIDITISIAK